MLHWCRVFGRSDDCPAATALAELARVLGAAGEAEFTMGPAGWYAASIGIGRGSPLELERFLAQEEGVRGELNSWAAWLETCGPSAVPLMEQMIQTRQLFTIHCPDDTDPALAECVCVGLCQLLARQTDGVWQVDGRGFFDAQGTLLVEEPRELP